ncbi:hypothetical protein OHD16_24120 [Sphingobacterium sp. ML3W]|uniref:hypothetical protein n=1 Tax=Sphingobacterium sp. ML3W TaxID=1538644 RepID=UPI00249A95D2|nr:hypothetical protein [Sphingobacterium sp. ML3W]WFA77795.1 hypothetical protein OGI71_17260 [Sphingobacterium sp. ML3W]
MEVIIKRSYLCTTPQGRDGYFERRDHEKKKGLTGVRRGNRKKGKEKKLQKFFGISKKISTFAVPTETEGDRKKIKRAQCHRNIADTEVEAREVL